MTVDWANFTPWTSLAGGILIGVSATMLLFFNGRIAGISGILGGLFAQTRGDSAWRIAFLAGLVISPYIFALGMPLPTVEIVTGYPLLILAGLLVGFGTRYGSGCTSGHGICGLSRGSRRSVAATAAFMAAGFGTVYIARHLMN